jgi:hypothetical protein
LTSVQEFAAGIGLDDHLGKHVTLCGERSCHGSREYQGGWSRCEDRQSFAKKEARTCCAH